MSEGMYLVCDPQSGWSVRALDQFGNTMQVLTDGHLTLEAAIRELAVGLGKPIALKLSPGQTF